MLDMGQTNSQQTDERGLAQEYLTFTLGPEEYAIDILKVQEIRGYEKPTAIANAPNFIKGVVNLRGTIVPIVDMRLKFNCEKAEYNSFTAVIILNLRARIVGIVVDSVSDVMELPPDDRAGWIVRREPGSGRVRTRYLGRRRFRRLRPVWFRRHIPGSGSCHARRGKALPPDSA